MYDFQSNVYHLMWCEEYTCIFPDIFIENVSKLIDIENEKGSWENIIHDKTIFNVKIPTGQLHWTEFHWWID